MKTAFELQNISVAHVAWSLQCAQALMIGLIVWLNPALVMIQNVKLIF